VKLPQDFIDKVRESSNLVDIVGQYVQLRRTGSNYQGVCPFHSDRSPSFSVSEEKQVYHCFGCGKSGNVFNFVEDHLGMTFREAVEYLARRATIPIPENHSEPAGQRDIKHTLFKVNSLAAQFYHQQLLDAPADHPVRKYLVKRQLSDEVVAAYKLGYAPDAWSELAQHFSNMRVPVSAAEQVGLVRKRNSGQGHFDMFRDRLIFPIFSTTKQCIGFGGRVIGGDQTPKYLNSVDSAVFHKGKVFYGLDHAIKHIREEDEVIVVEGYMDWLALAKASIKNVVATLGTALTPEHAKLIKRYTQRVLLLFDGDSAGKNAARRSLPILLSEGLMVRGLFLPDELDPDEFLQERGEPALRLQIKSAPDLFELIALEAWGQAKSSPSGTVQLLDELAPVLAMAQDARLRRLYASSLANMLNVDVRLVEQSVARPAQSPSQPPSVTARTPVAETPQPKSPAPVKFELAKLPRAELELLNLVLMKEVYLKEALRAEIGDEFSNLGARQVFRRIAEVYGQMPSKFDTLSALLAGEVKPAEMITRHLAEPYTSLNEEALNKLLQDCIKRVKETHLRTKSRELVTGLRAADPSKSAEQLEQIMKVQRSRRNLNHDS
jgi:DNA primase